MTHPVIAPKKLIEVALPLDRINEAAAREKSIRHGHPSTLHLWWARRPLAAARAVLFGQLVNDPSWKWEAEHSGEVPPNNLKASWAASRKRLFAIIEDLVKWENTTNEEVLKKAREEIRRSWRETCEANRDHPQAAELFNPEKMPGLHDPFAGGGTIPLEAQRLGLEAHASDLNPVAVLINKAMIEIPPKFAGKPPVNPESRRDTSLVSAEWKGAAGLAEDVRYYGRWMRDEAQKRIGHLYPPVEVTKEMAKDRPDLKPYIGEKLTVIAWLWARTVKSPSPAFRHVDVPLASTFILSSKPGKETYVQPVIDGDTYRFMVKIGKPPEGAKLGTRAGKAQDFRCLMSSTPVSRGYVQAEGKAGRIGCKLMAVVAEGQRGRVYLDPTEAQQALATSASASAMVKEARASFLAGSTPTRAMITGGVCSAYGLTTWGDLFTGRQLLALTTLSDLVGEAREVICRHALAAGMPNTDRSLDTCGSGSKAYAEAVSLYLAFALSRMANYSSCLCVWSSHPKDELAKQVFLRQALPMTWDYAETNPFSSAGGTLDVNVSYLVKTFERLPACVKSQSTQADARTFVDNIRIISTDPPYYDNVGYAELSDFFYNWLRRSLKSVFPELLATIAVPKAEELVAIPYRHGSKEKAETFFLDGMTRVMSSCASRSHPSTPIIIYYAFKQSETEQHGATTSTGWETFLEALNSSGLVLTGTWPMRTELTANLKKSVNALASSIILVCRPRPDDAPTTSRRAFLRELNLALPLALDEMTRASVGEHSPVAPVDLSQAIIGPGMAIFSKYAAVLEADGKPMTVRTALQLINRFLAEDDFDADTQFCLQWFEQYGWEDGPFGTAEILARAKGTAVEGVRQAGVIESGGGIVRLLKWSEYPIDWDPKTDTRLPVWEALHHMIRLHRMEGDSPAGRVLAAMRDKTEAIRQLAYRLYTLCERTKRAEDARAYNELITSWGGVEAAAATEPTRKQGTLFDTEG